MKRPIIPDVTIKARVEAGKSDADIADEFGVTPEHVKQRRYRLRLRPGTDRRSLRTERVDVDEARMLELLAAPDSTYAGVAHELGVSPRTVSLRAQKLGVTSAYVKHAE